MPISPAHLLRSLCILALFLLLHAAPSFAQETVLYRVNAGGELVENWEGDTEISPAPYLLNGSANIETIRNTATLDASVPAGTPLALFDTKRIDANQPEPFMRWDFSISQSEEVEVRLFFIEMSRCSVGNRLFDITIDGVLVADSFDVYAEAGSQCNVGFMRTYTTIADAGGLTIEFPLANGKPSIIAGIEIVSLGSPAEPATLAADPVSLNFGKIREGTTSFPLTVTLTNEGVETITVDDITLAGSSPTRFSFEPLSVTSIPGGSSSALDVFFSPSNLLLPPPPPFFNEDTVYRINAGGGYVPDPMENWELDTDAFPSPYLTSGATIIETDTLSPTLDASVPDGTPTNLFLTNRAGVASTSQMLWHFPVTDFAEYEIRLYFIEQSVCESGARKFSVHINGSPVLSNFNIFNQAGGCNTGIMRSHTISTQFSPTLEIELLPSSDHAPTIAAIEIIGPDVTQVAQLNAELIVSHTGANPALTIDLTGGGELSFFANDFPNAAFQVDTDGLAVNFTDLSTDSDGTITSWAWDFGDGNTSSDQNPAHTYAAAGTYDVILAVTDDDGDGDLITISVEVEEVSGGTGAFIESDGLVVMEAENAHANIPHNGQAWEASTDNAGFSGASHLVATPDVGEIYKTNELDQSPELQFEVDFTTTGSYNFWLRMAAFHWKSNAVHVGVDGVLHEINSTVGTGSTGAWGWESAYHHGSKLAFEITTPGIHTINVWVRSDGVILDKMLFINDDGFIPSADGPPESVRAGAEVASQAGQMAGDLLSPLHQAAVLPEVFTLKNNYPNPFNPTTTIAFELPEPSTVTLEVFNTMGQRIATLVNGQYGAGRHEAQWHAVTDGGARVASGIYLYRLKAGDFEAVNRMVLMK